MSYQFQPLGTIIASMLNFDQLCASMQENPAFDCLRSTYAPCDGRIIAGSQLDLRTNRTINKSPDLRGKFLRGLNEIYGPGQPLPFDAATIGDPEPNRVAGSLQKDMVGPHTHSAHSSGNFAFTTSGMGIQNNSGQQVQFGPPPISVDPTTDPETRPRNVAVYYYVKIN